MSEETNEMSMSEVKRVSTLMGLSEIEQELCIYFNRCFLNSESNPITMAKWITKTFKVEKRGK